MFNFSIENSLHKYAEKNLGENVMAIFSHSQEDFDFSQFPHFFGKKFKINLLGLDIFSPEEKNKISLSNTFNKYYFVSYLIIDSYLFKLLNQTHHRIRFDKFKLKKIIVFDPVSSDALGYYSLLGQKIVLPNKKNIQFESYDYLNANVIEFISISDKRYALKLASNINNSKLTLIDNYEKFTKILKNEFDK